MDSSPYRHRRRLASGLLDLRQLRMVSRPRQGSLTQASEKSNLEFDADLHDLRAGDLEERSRALGVVVQGEQRLRHRGSPGRRPDGMIVSSV